MQVGHRTCDSLNMLALVLVVYLLTTTCAEQHPADEDGPLSEVQTAVNLELILPCDLKPGTMIPDKVQTIIWFKQGHDKPIYTFDARGRQLQNAIPWVDELVLKHKARFFYDTNPPSLRIKNVEVTDAGLYKCRVDFHKSPTQNWRINVTVLVPPNKLTILDPYGASINDGVAGPYLEGNDVNLTCLSSGGRPPPKVTWWQEHALIDDSYVVLADGTVRNTLHLHSISRKNLLTVYTCQASNGHVVAALSEKVTLEMSLPPLNILLQGINHPLIAGVTTQVTCTTVGARPPPEIIWKKDGAAMTGATHSTSSDGNSTISQLTFTPVPEDDKKEVACFVPKTVMSQYPNEYSVSAMEPFLKDSRILNITHSPIVSLKLGGPLDANNLKNGSDVFLECHIIANPPITRVEWYHNERKLQPGRGVIITNQTLVLQGISKYTQGKYFCSATNIQGNVSSNEIFLDVKYPPICTAETTIIRAAVKQSVNITCLVDSNPINNLNYEWKFNNSLDNSIDLPIIPSQMQMWQSAGPISMPLKGPASHTHHNHYYYQELHNHPQHHKKFAQKHHHSKGNFIDFEYDAQLVRKESKSSADMIHLKHNDFNIVNNQEMHLINVQEDIPLAEMLYSNMMYTNQLEKTRKVYKEQTKMENMYEPSLYVHKSRSRFSEPPPTLPNVYQYSIDSYESFGSISCVASNHMGRSNPCWYHVQPADIPDPVKNCTTANVTSNSLQVICTPGFDGGIKQHFHVQVYDELNRQILCNVTYKRADFKLKGLPSDSVFVVRITSINLQGPSKLVYRLRTRTLSMPLLRTASSTAVLVQLTPLLGALVGLIVTLILVVICIAIFITFRNKHVYRSNGLTTEAVDKGSVELLNRNLGSRSSLDDKNPDVVPLENSDDEFHVEDETFDSMDVELYGALCHEAQKCNASSSPPLLSSPLLEQNREMFLTPNPSYNICDTPERIRRPVYAQPPLTNKFSLSSYSRIPARSYLTTCVEDSPQASISGFSTVCAMPLLARQSSNYAESLQPHAQSSQSQYFRHNLTNENVLHLNSNTSS